MAEPPGSPGAAALTPAPAVPVRSITIALVLAVLVYVGAAVAADWEGVRRAAASMPFTVLLQMLATALASYVFRFLRWQGLLGALGHGLPWRRHFEIYLAGLALTVSPGKVGEMVRSVYLQAWGVPYSRSIAAFVCERTWDLAVVALLAGLAVLAFPAYWLTAALPLGLAAALFLVVRSPLAPAFVSRMARVPGTHAAAETVVALRRLFRADRLLPALACTLPTWMVQGLALYLIVGALGHDLALSAAVGIYALALLAGALSFIPGGLGATEAALVLLLKASGMGLADAVYAALIARALPLWLAVGIGVLAMVRAARHTPQSV